eukprot:scaffold26661_cov60-Cyclotella_meneghiniana.AAC.1
MHVLSNSHKESLRVRGQRQQKRQLSSSTQLHRNDNNRCVYSTQARAIGTTKTGIAIIDATASRKPINASEAFTDAFCHCRRWNRIDSKRAASVAITTNHSTLTQAKLAGVAFLLLGVFLFVMTLCPKFLLGMCVTSFMYGGVLGEAIAGDGSTAGVAFLLSVYWFIVWSTAGVAFLLLGVFLFVMTLCPMFLLGMCVTSFMYGGVLGEAIAGDGIELIPSGQPQLLSRRITQLLPKPSSQELPSSYR